ncbi:MAG TPA: sulfite exporter TauE/SafE family protein, partial [Xanthobacteraceae bacterium]|nr:sulfite exporter TauE/SafE family protein [Xanthobacteraceae bacterium]
SQANRWAGTVAPLLPVSIYTGYFGAGAGVMLLGVLSIATGGDYRSANLAKNLITSLNSVVAAIIFVVGDKIAWPASLTMMAGALIGALIGARLAQVVPREAMRVVVVVVGALLTVLFARRYWF